MRSRLTDHINTNTLDTKSIDPSYNPYVLNQAHYIRKYGIHDQAVSRKLVEAVTIDGSTSLDLDDAIWIERTKQGYTVFVHISDVSECISPFSPLDLDALNRTTSIYRRDQVINMLPPILSNEILSLNEGGEKLTVTLEIGLDNDGVVKTSSIYESKFKNLKRYDHKSFSDDFSNPESSYFSTLQLFSELSGKLRFQRGKIGGILGFQDEDRKLFLGKKPSNDKNTYGASLSHDIIESFMVLANHTIGNMLSLKNTSVLFRRHDNLDERSFYTQHPGFHTGLAIENYTHFTSPIRRYADIVVHRVLKLMIRGENSLYTSQDIKCIAEHINNTRTRVETIGAEIDYEIKAYDSLRRTKNRLGRDIEVYDLKGYIRMCADSKKKLPNCIKEAIIVKINTAPVDTWSWAIGVILFGKDKDLKILLKNKLIDEPLFSPTKLFHILEQTQILTGQKKIFTIEEKETPRRYQITVFLHDQKITSYSMNVGKYGDMNDIKGVTRMKIIEGIFKYFI